MAGHQDTRPTGRDTTASTSPGGPEEPLPTPGSEVGAREPESAPTPALTRKMKQLWRKLDLDLPTLLMMFKASLPPTIAVAMYQSEAVAGVYSTLGYMIAITAVMGMCILPRGMFVQTITLNILAVCVGAAVCLLALYCGIQARLHTAPPGSPPTAYNSSASAVLAVWLFFQTYLVNVLRGALPQFQFPVIIYSIFASVSLTYGTQFPSMSYATSFVQRLIAAFLTGFALATGVAFLVFPVSSRQVVFKEMAGYLNGLGGLLKLQAAYLASLETWEPEAAARKPDLDGHDATHAQGSSPVLMTGAGKMLKETLQKIYELHAKLPADISFAKREVAFGKLTPKDITEIWKRMRCILVPVVGLSSVLDILQRRAEESGWQHGVPRNVEGKARRRQVDDLHQLMHTLHEPVATQGANLNGAFQHVLYTLELVKPPKKKSTDEETPATGPIPGTPSFAEGYRQQLDQFYESKKQTLADWCHQHGIEIPPNFFDSTFVRPEQYDSRNEHARERHQRQLFFVLYVHHLLWKAGQAALELVLYADQRKQKGALNQTKLIVPGLKTCKKWVKAAFGKEDLHDEDLLTADLSAGRVLDLGASFGKSKDPEHLAPRNAWETIGEGIRLIPRAFRSDSSAFGFRVACATMTVAILCYSGDSQTWFLEKRILWAIITAILVIGYELQTRVVGIAVSESNGQPAYPTHLLEPYRLATVCGGLAVAYIWTIFPYPVSESTELRKDVGAALYMLANLSSVVHELVRARINQLDGDDHVKGTRAFHLEKARNRVFTKTLTLLTTLQQNSAFSRFQIRVGGRFPHAEYTGLIVSARHMAEPEYSAFAVIQICARCVHDDVGKITR